MDYYAEEYKKLHEMGYFSGFACVKQKYRIKKLIQHTDSKTLLDYGSGKGKQYSVKKLNEFWNVSIDCYDPYVKKFSILPNKKYDGVICSDVLEHVPEEQLETTLKSIFYRAEKFVFLCIFLKEAKKFFSDGKNVHVSIKSQMEWIELAQKFNSEKINLKIHFETR